MQADERPHAAAGMMAMLAPVDRTGYGPAHLWQAERLVQAQPTADGRGAPPTPQMLLDAERHLIRALQWNGERVKLAAHFGLARLYQTLNRIEDAKVHLTEVAAKVPEYRLTLAEWARLQGDQEAAHAH